MLMSSWVACLWPLVETTPQKFIIFQIHSDKVVLYFSDG